jgi:ABC-type multidrug transport system fused ATPase/permease subunit
MVKKWILGEFLKNNRVKYLFGLSALITSSFLQLIIPKLIGYITDCLEVKSQSVGKITLLSGAILLTAIFLFAMKFLLRYFLMGRSRDLECFLRAKLFAHLQTLPPKFYNNKKTGDLMAYAINDLNAIRQAFAFGLVFLIDGIIINLASIFVMGKTIHPVLTTVTLVPVILSVFFILFFISSNLMIHFKLLTEFEQEKIKYEKLNKIGFLEKEISLNISKELRIIFLIPSIAGMCLGTYFIYLKILSIGIGSFNEISYSLNTGIVYMILELIFYILYKKYYIKKILF